MGILTPEPSAKPGFSCLCLGPRQLSHALPQPRC